MPWVRSGGLIGIAPAAKAESGRSESPAAASVPSFRASRRVRCFISSKEDQNGERGYFLNWLEEGEDHLKAARPAATRGDSAWCFRGQSIRLGPTPNESSFPFTPPCDRRGSRCEL